MTAIRGARSLPRRLPLGRPRAIEALLLLTFPGLATFLLRLRTMSPQGLPDAAMHSVFLWDPGDWAMRYAPRVLGQHWRTYIGPAAAYLRWGTRPGFLVPGRIFYLLFGTLGGFFTFRYVLVLLAIVPAYLLFKRLYGVWAGVLAICLIVSSPVIVTAWGTDFPDSATVSYLIACICCLVMPAVGVRERRWWLAAAAGLATMALWALLSNVLILAATGAVWLLVRFVRDRERLLGDLGVMAAVVVAVTAVLVLLSWLLLGQADFILPSIQAVEFLSTPAQVLIWHSKSPAWAPYDLYLLALPAVLLAAVVVFGARLRRLQTPVLVIGASALVQLVATAWGQFRGTLQLLEVHFLSSPLWAASLLLLAIVVAEITSPLASGRITRFIPASLTVLLVWVYELGWHLNGYTWWPVGFVLVAVVLLTAWIARRSAAAERSRLGVAVASVAVFMMLGALLVLTVDPQKDHVIPKNTILHPLTNYDHALGGSSQLLINEYELQWKVREWTPNATYRGEQLLVCLPGVVTAEYNVSQLFHAQINSIGYCPNLSAGAIHEIKHRKAAQLLVYSHHHMNISELMHRLRRLHPIIAKHDVLRSGQQRDYVWLIEFPQYLDRHAV